MVCPVVTSLSLAQKEKGREPSDQKSAAASDDSRDSQDAPEREKTLTKRLTEDARRLFAELLGTFFLTLSAAGGIVIGAVSHGEIGEAARTVAPGLVVMALIYALGDVSGAHYNPAVTLAFTLRGDFPLRRVPGYWLAQIVGALLAAWLLLSLFGHTGHLGATRPHHGVHAAFVMETVLTGLLVLVILGTATRYSLVGPNAALAVGGTIALCGLFADPISNASMNPARSLGPMLVGGDLRYAWVYLAGPFLGSVIATLCMLALHRQHNSKEDEVAKGDGK